MSAARVAPTLRYTAVGAYRIHSLHAGAGEPVVLLHGLSGSARWWQFTVPALAQHYSVHVPELAGFGHSRPAPKQFSIDQLTTLIEEWLRLERLEQPRMIGHSMGAQLAIHLAARAARPLRRLVLANASGIPRRLTPLEVARLLTDLVPPRAWGTPRFLPSIAADALRSGPRTLLRAARALLADDVRPLLPRIRTPTLVVWGARDPLTPLAHGRIIADGIPDARLLVLEQAAHNAMVDRAEEFNRAILDFFAA